jgi:hypothetical protein
VGVTTDTGPLTAPSGTTATICVAEFTVKVCATVPPKKTAVAPVKSLPVIVTDVPAGPLVGVNDVMTGIAMDIGSTGRSRSNALKEQGEQG